MLFKLSVEELRDELASDLFRLAREERNYIKLLFTNESSLESLLKRIEVIQAKKNEVRRRLASQILAH